MISVGLHLNIKSPSTVILSRKMDSGLTNTPFSDLQSFIILNPLALYQNSRCALRYLTKPLKNSYNLKSLILHAEALSPN